MSGVGTVSRLSAVWIATVASVVVAAQLPAQSRQQPSPETVAVLVRGYLQHRLEITGRAPIVRFCGRTTLLLNEADRDKLVADGVAAAVDTTCREDGPPPDVVRQVTTVDIYHAAIDSNSTRLFVAQIHGDKWSLLETADFIGSGSWYLTGITFGRLARDNGSFVPYTTRSNRPASRPGFPPDSGR